MRAPYIIPLLVGIIVLTAYYTVLSPMSARSSGSVEVIESVEPPSNNMICFDYSYGEIKVCTIKVRGDVFTSVEPYLMLTSTKLKVCDLTSRSCRETRAKTMRLTDGMYEIYFSSSSPGRYCIVFK